MGEPWIDVKSNIASGSGFLRLLPTTATDMVITALGTDKIDLLQITNENTKYPSLAPKMDKITQELSTGITVVAPKPKVFVSAVDGYKTGEDVEYSFEMKAIMSISKWKLIKENIASPFFAVKGRGYDVQGNHLGFQFLLGYVDGLDLPLQAGFVEVTLTVKGGFKHTLGNGINLSAINTKLQGQIEAVGKAPVTIPALVDADLSILLSGGIVDKDQT